MEERRTTIGKLISSVVPLQEKNLEIHLCTGSVLRLNMKNRLQTVRFSPLNDERVFRSVTTDGFYLRFDTQPNYGLDFTLREAVLMALNAPPNTYQGFDPFEHGA